MIYNLIGWLYNFVIPEANVKDIFESDKFQSMQKYIDENLEKIQKDVMKVKLPTLNNVADFDPGHGELMGKTENKNGWKILFFKEIGHRHISYEFPEIEKFLDKYSGMFFNASISVLLPGAEIPIHAAACEALLKYHVPITIPKGDLGLQAGDSVYRWSDKDCLLFNDSIPHKAWNHTEKVRVVLLFDYIREDTWYLRFITPIVLKLASMIYWLW